MTLGFFAAAAFLAVVMASGLFLLFFNALTLAFAVVYGRTRSEDPPPGRAFAAPELPRVTVQLPIRNEGRVAERVIRAASVLAYPTQHLQIQVLDDSDDRTSEVIEAVVAQVRREQPDLDINVTRRGTREGFKAGALRLGSEKATGELFAIFDADFLIPPDFLARTIHYFTDPKVGVVQARWAYLNRSHSRLTRFQAAKLDAHQMFDQSARARLGWWAHFHGTAGVIRREALEDAGGWNCVSEVEDIELTIRMFLKGWTTIYLDGFRVASELPETMTGFLQQQMRWKRGWIRVFRYYALPILRSPGPRAQRLDIIGRLLNAWGSAAAIPVTFGALPAFLIAERFGLWWPIFSIYTLMFVLAVGMRLAEARYVEEPVQEGVAGPLRWLRLLVPTGLILNMGLTPALTQGTLEGFGRTQQWDVTPKSGSFAQALTTRPRIPTSILVTMASAFVSAIFLIASVGLGHFLAAGFYLMMTIGAAWVALACLRERAARWSARASTG